jgi:hypothetical protein
MACKPEDILGKAGTGAVLSLEAIGLQDGYLTSNAGNSFFQFTNTKHTQFTKYSASVQVNNDGSTNWPFNQILTVNFRPKEMCDILQNMYIKCTLPSLANVQGGPPLGQYCDNVGLAMFNQIQLNADDTILEIIKTDWNLVYTELYYSIEEAQAYNTIVNVDPIKGGDLYIPLHFFFSRRHSSSFTANPVYHDNFYFKPGFLTCAAHKHRNLSLMLTFNPTTFFSSAPASAVSLSNFYVVTEEIVLSDAERNYLQNTVQKNIISFTRNEAVYPVRQSPVVANMTQNIPVKIIHWFVRNKLYENISDPTYFNNRFNFSSQNYNLPFSSSSTLTQQETNNPILSQVVLYLNGNQVNPLAQTVTVRNRRDGSYYWKFIQPLSHGLSYPSRNIYTFSFCIKPIDPQPSGSLDFSQMDSNSTFINASIYSVNNAPPRTSYNMYIFYTGFNTVTYSNGLVSLDFGW